MEKILFKTIEECDKWKEEANNWSWPHRETIKKLLKEVGSPTSCPALLVFEIGDDSDDGLFITSEFIYLCDFHGPA